MDQLDILKQSWQSQTDSAPRFSKEQLYVLLARKSSSIVKWLFFIAIIEFVLFIVLGIISHFTNEKNDTIEMIGEPFYYGSMILHYLVIVLFIFLFYKNYKNISTSQPIKRLMDRILRTRRTMKWYIWYNLIYVMTVGMIGAVIIIPHDPRISELLNSPNFIGHETTFYAAFLGLTFVIFLILCVVLYLIYMLIYGILLNKLKRNYNELKRMEI